MDKIVINGGYRLTGEIKVSGAKNSALPLLCASILIPGKTIYRNVPRLGDIITTGKLLALMGADVDLDWPVVTIDTTELEQPFAPYEVVKTMRAAILVLGPLVARFGKAKVSLPGGCAIGARPIDLHLKGLEAMGAKVQINHGYVEVTADKLKGAHIRFEKTTVGGTENLMMTAALADGITILENAACEPEIVDLAEFLNKAGADIEGAGSPLITIRGQKSLHPVEHSVIPDRIEAGTFMIAAAITTGDVLIKNVIPKHVESLILKMKAAGINIKTTQNSIRVIGNDKITPVDVVTSPYPEFPTDMQAQFMVLALAAHGKSMITESIFENRYMHVPELVRMGADIQINGKTAIIKGPAVLEGTTVMATDLRASASLILAGLIASGETEILRVYHLDRGYEKIEEKLSGIGAKIRRISGAGF